MGLLSFLQKKSHQKYLFHLHLQMDLLLLLELKQKQVQRNLKKLVFFFFIRKVVIRKWCKKDKKGRSQEICSLLGFLHFLFRSLFCWTLHISYPFFRYRVSVGDFFLFFHSVKSLFFFAFFLFFLFFLFSLNTIIRIGFIEQRSIFWGFNKRRGSKWV